MQASANSMKIKRLALHANFIALGVALGYALALIPNIELVSTCVFLSGLIMGVRSGAVVGLLTEFIYSNFNIFGPAPLHTLIGQLTAMTLTGIMGGLWARWLDTPLRSWRNRVLLALAGFVITLNFDILTTLPDALFIEATWSFLIARFSIGSVFYFLHTLSNIFIFALIIPELLHVLSGNEFVMRFNSYPFLKKSEDRTQIED